MRREVLFCLGLGLSQAGLGVADELRLVDEGSLTIGGFGTIGGAYNANAEAEFIRDRSQPEGAADGRFDLGLDSRLGVQINWRPNEPLEGVLQLVAKRRYDGTYRPQLSWAFLGYAFDPDIRLRVGRLGYDVYLMSDSRDVGYSYLWVRPPVDYFGQVHYSHLDGLDLTVSRVLGDGVLKGKLFAGLLNETGTSPQGEDYEMEGSTLWGGYLDYQDPHWQMRAGVGVMRLRHEFELYAPLLDALRGTGVPEAVALAGDLEVADKDFYFVSTGIGYDAGPLQSQFQLRYLWVDTPSYADNVAGYWSLGYRLGRWTPYIVYSRIKSEHRHLDTGLPDRNPYYAAINDGVEQILQATQVDQETLSLGARFDFARNAALKLQVDWVHSRDNPSLLWLDPDPDWDGRATLFSAALDFVF